MIIYRDFFCGQELFTDSNAMKKDFSGEVIRVDCHERVDEVQNDYNIGANASQEEQGEELEQCVTRGIDVVMNEGLIEVTGDYSSPKQYFNELKMYIKRIAGDMKEKGKACEGKCFLDAVEQLKAEIKGNFNDIQFFAPPDFYEYDVDKRPYVIPLHRCPKSGKITMLFLNRGLQEEKS